MRWSAETCITCEGATVRLRSNQPGILEQVSLPPGSEVTPKTEPSQTFSLWVNDEHRVYRDARCILKTTDLNRAIRHLASELHVAVAKHSPALFVHAGVVGWKGRAILLPATTHGGKTTLVRELSRLGATYYSDEYAVFDDEGHIRSYPRHLSVREPAGPARSVDPVEEGFTIGREAIPLGLVVFSRYRQGAKWRPKPLSPAACMLGMIENTVMARSRPEQCMRVLGRAAASCTAIRTARGEASETARIILDSVSW